MPTSRRCGPMDVEVVTIERGEDDVEFERPARETEAAARRRRADLPGRARRRRVARLADFLERVDRESELGPWSYEVADTKLARRSKPAHVLQLCFYSEQVARIQGREPERMHLILGTRERETLRPADFGAYYRRVRERFLRAVAERDDAYPYPVQHCELCDFRERCERQWDEDDHLSRVAGMRRDQVERLSVAGITRLAELAGAPAALEVPRLAPSTSRSCASRAPARRTHNRRAATACSRRRSAASHCCRSFARRSLLRHRG